MNYYYVSKSNETAGPVPLETLKALRDSGEVDGQTQVVAEGMSEWKPLHTLPEFAQEGSPSSVPPVAPAPAAAHPLLSGGWELVLGNLVEFVLRFSKRWLTPDLARKVRLWGLRYGHMAILVTAGAGIFGGIIAAIRFKDDGLSILFLCLILVLILAVAQFSANRFMQACELLLRATPTRTSSPAVYDIFGLVHLGLGLILALVALGGAIAAGGMGLLGIFFSLLFLIIFWAAATGSFHTSELAMEVDESTGPGENTVAFFSFFLKLSLYLAPIGFGVLTLLGGIVQVVAILVLLINPAAIQSLGQVLPMMEEMGFVGGFILTILGAALPFLTYLFFLIFYLSIDLMRSILAIPVKLDEVIRKG